MKSRAVLSMVFALWSWNASAQREPGVVLILCDEWRYPAPVSQSSPGAVSVEPFAANCAADLEKVLGSGYTLAFLESNHDALPLYVFEEPASVGPAPARTEVAVLACYLNLSWDDYVVEAAG